ncbi:MAG: hypothetical protein DMG46_26840 [Acidobacteria bacterium]|nr:MAG: hypothetical protein DMG46_26840 [Acidobacteriota bacterium]
MPRRIPSQVAGKFWFGTYLSRDELLVPLNLYFLSFRTALAVRNLLSLAFPQLVQPCRKRPWKTAASAAEDVAPDVRGISELGSVSMPEGMP